jgi:hypothetical protein
MSKHEGSLLWAEIYAHMLFDNGTATAAAIAAASNGDGEGEGGGASAECECINASE